MPEPDTFVKTKNENGLHVFTINLDANQDGNGVSPWSIVGIVVLTLVILWVIIKLKECLTHKIKLHKAGKPVDMGPIQFIPRHPEQMADIERAPEYQAQFIQAAPAPPTPRGGGARGGAEDVTILKC